MTMTQKLTLTDHRNYVTATKKPADLINRDISAHEFRNKRWMEMAKWRKSLLKA